jgi:hypothetical protein
MQDYTRLKAQALAAIESGGSQERDDVAWLLVLEQLIFQTEAEARWLDHCEVRLIRLSAAAERGAGHPKAAHAPEAPPGSPPAPQPAATTRSSPPTSSSTP